MLCRTVTAHVAGVAGLAGALIAAPVAAAGSGAAQGGAYDPNERVCEKITVTGSRLATKTVCMTRAQWDERKRDDRDVIERAQRSANAPCSTVNTHTGAPVCG
jgi:hypothetical protein